MEREKIKEHLRMLNKMVEDYLDLLDIDEAEEAETVKNEDGVLEDKDREMEEAEEV